MRKGGVFAGHYGIVPFQELKDTYIPHNYLHHAKAFNNNVCYDLFLKYSLDPRGNVSHTL